MLLLRPAYRQTFLITEELGEIHMGANKNKGKPMWIYFMAYTLWLYPTAAGGGDAATGRSVVVTAPPCEGERPILS